MRIFKIRRLQGISKSGGNGCHHCQAREPSNPLADGSRSAGIAAGVQKNILEILKGALFGVQTD